MTVDNNVLAPVVSIDPWLQKARREGVRWFCLKHLYESRPEGLTEPLLQTLLCSSYTQMQPRELRCELDYLSMLGFLTITATPTRPWHLALTYQGVDLVEYNIECPPGIRRPLPPPTQC